MTESIICSLIAGIFSYLAAAQTMKRTNQEKEIEHARFQQMMEDRVKGLEEIEENNTSLVKRLNSMENLLIELKKDIEYLKKGIK